MTESAKMGRPTKYTEELATRICKAVATRTCGLHKICDEFPDFPVPSTINEWRYDKIDFSAKYTRAKAQQAELLAEEITTISDDATNDWMEYYDSQNECSGWRINGEHVQRSRLRVDSRKWLASKLAPKIYGDAKRVEELEGENERVKAELRALRDKLDKANTAEY